MTTGVLLADLPERIRSKIEVTSGCWNWTAHRNPLGYGQCRFDGRTQKAHRVVYQLLVGPIPTGLTLDHLCRNTSCVNPAHLEPVTMRENTLRGVGPSARAARAKECPQGHPYDDENTLHSGGRRYCRTCHRKRSATPVECPVCGVTVQKGNLSPHRRAHHGGGQ